MSAVPPQPRIVVTLPVAVPRAGSDLAARRNALHLDAIRRHGGGAVGLDARASGADRRTALESMDGLLFSGGGDLDPARYGRPNEGSRDIEAERDELEADAWAAAQARGVPVLGICRGLQVMNAFAGGVLLQHVDGHQGPGWARGPALTHPIRLVAGTATARILDPVGSGDDLVVNSYHHQGVRVADLAPGFTAAAYADSPAGPLVEALEAASGPWRMAVQCHPERRESTPGAFEALFAAFVAACRAG